MSKGPLPQQVNYRTLALENCLLEGPIPLSAFRRLAGILAFESAEVKVRLEFRQERKHKVLIIGTAKVRVPMVCQNCLSSLHQVLSVDCRQVVVEDETALGELPEDVDGLVGSQGKIRLVDVFEDELILSVPMISRHRNGDCKATIDHQQDDLVAESDTYRPFAALAELKNEIKGASDGRPKK